MDGFKCNAMPSIILPNDMSISYNFSVLRFDHISKHPLRGYVLDPLEGLSDLVLTNFAPHGIDLFSSMNCNRIIMVFFEAHNMMKLCRCGNGTRTIEVITDVKVEIVI